MGEKESLSPVVPLTSSHTEDDDVGFLSNPDDEEDNLAAWSELDNEDSGDDESIIVVENNGGQWGTNCRTFCILSIKNRARQQFPARQMARLLL